MSLRTISTTNGDLRIFSSISLSSSNHPPLVLVHGLESNCALFATLAPKLEGFAPILCPDLEGHGRSPLSPSSRESPPTMDDYVECLKSYLIHNGINASRPATLVAHAEGVFIVAHFASLFPDFVYSLILICPVIPSSDRVNPLSSMYRTLARERSPKDMNEILARLTVQEDLELRTKVHAMLSEGTPETMEGFERLSRILEDTVEPDFTSLVPIRALILAGKRDSHIPPSMVHHLVHSLRVNPITQAKEDVDSLLHHHGTFSTVKDTHWRRETRIVEVEAGHWMPLEKPDECAQHMLKFLRE